MFSFATTCAHACLKWPEKKCTFIFLSLDEAIQQHNWSSCKSGSCTCCNIYLNQYSNIYLSCHSTTARILARCINPPHLIPLGISAWGTVPLFPITRNFWVAYGHHSADALIYLLIFTHREKYVSNMLCTHYVLTFQQFFSRLTVFFHYKLLTDNISY